MYKNCILLFSLILSIDSRRFSAQPSPQEHKTQALPFQLNKTIQFEQLSDSIIQFFEKSMNISKIYENSLVSIVYPHALNRTNEIQKITFIEQTKEPAIQIKEVKQNHADSRQNIAFKSNFNVKRKKESFDRQEQHTTKFTQSSLRRNIPNETQENHSTRQHNRKYTIAIWVSALTMMAILSKCCKRKNNYQSLSSNDTEISFEQVS